MFQACPEIHRDCAELDFYFHVFFPVGQEDGDVQDQVEASIAVLLGIFDVVLLAHQDNIVLFDEKLSQTVDIIWERADDTKPGHVR